MGQRVRAVHRFTIELELVTADDIGPDDLATTLASLATAGLHGMVAAVLSVSLDGVTRRTGVSHDPSRVKVPTDPRVKRAMWELEDVLKLLRSIDPPVEALAPVSSL